MMRFVNMISGGGSTNLKVLKAEQPGGLLSGLTETVAIISSDPEAGGIKKALNLGFSKTNIHIVLEDENLEKNLLELLGLYQPDYFHQLGWTPLTPKEVMEKFTGLNQHLGPGGRYMVGVRRVYAHIRFCVETGRKLEIPIYCQYVHSDYDMGKIIYQVNHGVSLVETPDKISEIILPVEHLVQIFGRERLALGLTDTMPLPVYAKNEKEKKLLEKIKIEAKLIYPRKDW